MTEPRQLRLLLSAYACEPSKGSEPGVGWNWVIALARRGHEVWVLTRRNNQQNIESECLRLDESLRERLHFIYYDLPSWATWWKKGGRGVRLYYLLWQWGAYRVAKCAHASQRFDWVHHITFASVRQPSFMGSLGIPFIFGPVAGGESAPWSLRSGYGWRGWLLDASRDAMNSLIKFDPFMRRTFASAERIYVTSDQTQKLVPRHYWSKIRIRLAIAVEKKQISVNIDERTTRSPRLVYLGRFLYWKGLHLGLEAFSIFLRRYPDARLTLIGRGPEEARWRNLAEKLGVEESIDWLPWINQSDLAKVYSRHDVLLFPSLHDSGGMVVLEAMQHGLPVVCLKLGGPSALVDETCGIAIDPDEKTPERLTNEMASALTRLFDDRTELKRLSSAAIRRANGMDWDSLAEEIYTDLEAATTLRTHAT